MEAKTTKLSLKVIAKMKQEVRMIVEVRRKVNASVEANASVKVLHRMTSALKTMENQ